MTITKHAYKRGKDRLGLSKKALARMLDKVVANGIEHKHAHGKLGNYLDYKWAVEQNASKFIVYGGHIYVFRGDTLITILKLSYKLCKIATEQAKEVTQCS